MDVHSYAAYEPAGCFKYYTFQERELRDDDVAIDIAYCGVCHSDIHQVRNEWGEGIFPMVPGHEIVGLVRKIGKHVKKFKVGDRVGVGCMVDSCSTCSSCCDNLEQYCENGFVPTYNALETYKDGVSPTYGGYSTSIIVKEDFVLRIPESLPLNHAAPLLCAGITTYSPLKHWKVGPGKKVAVVGLGGLGHMAVKIAHALGAHVSVISTSNRKIDDAKRFGAQEFFIIKDSKQMERAVKMFDVLVNTVPDSSDFDQLLSFVRRDGTMIILGVSGKKNSVDATPLVMKRCSIAGSLIGGIQETQEMLDFCALHAIFADVEMIGIEQIDGAYNRMMKSDVRYRFVIDIESFKKRMENK